MTATKFFDIKINPIPNKDNNHEVLEKYVLTFGFLEKLDLPSNIFSGIWDVVNNGQLEIKFISHENYIKFKSRVQEATIFLNSYPVRVKAYYRCFVEVPQGSSDDLTNYYCHFIIDNITQGNLQEQLADSAKQAGLPRGVFKYNSVLNCFYMDKKSYNTWRNFHSQSHNIPDPLNLKDYIYYIRQNGKNHQASVPNGALDILNKKVSLLDYNRGVKSEFKPHKISSLALNFKPYGEDQYALDQIFQFSPFNYYKTLQKFYKNHFNLTNIFKCDKDSNNQPVILVSKENKDIIQDELDKAIYFNSINTSVPVHIRPLFPIYNENGEILFYRHYFFYSNQENIFNKSLKKLNYTQGNINFKFIKEERCFEIDPPGYKEWEKLVNQRGYYFRNYSLNDLMEFLKKSKYTAPKYLTYLVTQQAPIKPKLANQETAPKSSSSYDNSRLIITEKPRRNLKRRVVRDEPIETVTSPNTNPNKVTESSLAEDIKVILQRAESSENGLITLFDNALSENKVDLLIGFINLDSTTGIKFLELVFLLNEEYNSSRNLSKLTVKIFNSTLTIEQKRDFFYFLMDKKEQFLAMLKSCNISYQIKDEQSQNLYLQLLRDTFPDSIQRTQKRARTKVYENPNQSTFFKILSSRVDIKQQDIEINIDEVLNKMRQLLKPHLNSSYQNCGYVTEACINGLYQLLMGHEVDRLIINKENTAKDRSADFFRREQLNKVKEERAIASLSGLHSHLPLEITPIIKLESDQTIEQEIITIEPELVTTKACHYTSLSSRLQADADKASALLIGELSFEGYNENEGHVIAFLATCEKTYYFEINQVKNKEFDPIITGLSDIYSFTNGRQKQGFVSFQPICHYLVHHRINADIVSNHKQSNFR